MSKRRKSPPRITPGPKIDKGDKVTVLYDNKFFFTGIVVTTPYKSTLKIYNDIFGVLEWNFEITPGVITEHSKFEQRSTLPEHYQTVSTVKDGE